MPGLPPGTSQLQGRRNGHWNSITPANSLNWLLKTGHANLRQRHLHPMRHRDACSRFIKQFNAFHIARTAGIFAADQGSRTPARIGNLGLLLDGFFRVLAA